MKSWEYIALVWSATYEKSTLDNNLWTETHISLYWSNALLASCSNFLSFSDGTAPSSNGGSYVLLHGDLQIVTYDEYTCIEIHSSLY
jgi:hypothetical protein